MTRAERIIQALRELIPPLDCARCGGCCGPGIPWTGWELDQLATEHQRAVVQAHTEAQYCPLLTAENRCSVYDDRPLLCRLMGTVPGMACREGHTPEGGFLPWPVERRIMRRYMGLIETDLLLGRALEPGRPRLRL